MLDEGTADKGNALLQFSDVKPLNKSIVWSCNYILHRVILSDTISQPTLAVC